MTRTSAPKLRGLHLVTLEADPPPAPPKTRAAAKKRVDQYELAPEGAAAKAAKQPEIHRLVGEYDARGIRRHLKAHPEDINTRNDAGDTPLHAIAAKGAVLIAEALDELGPDHLANNRRGLLPGHLAAEKHPKTAQFLFESALATKRYEASWHPFQDLAQKINALCAKGQPAPAAIDDLAASLCGIPRSELNAAGEVVKNRTHLEAIKGTVLEMKAEGWWQDKFVPQRVRALLRGAIAAPKELRPALVREIATQLDLLRTVRRIYATKKCPHENIRSMAMMLEARQIAHRVLHAQPGEETALPLGWQGHAIYGGLVTKRADRAAGHAEDTLLLHIDNLGSGSTLMHDKAQGLVESRGLHIPRAYLAEPAGERAFVELLRDLLLIHATNDTNADDFYARIARFKHELKAHVPGALVESNHGLLENIAMRSQIAGNCVVANTFPGLASRLGPQAFAWFQPFEHKLARELVDAHAATNQIIDEECKARDQRQLGVIIGEAGPWADRLRKLIEAGRGTYDVNALAREITAEQMKRVIDGGDAAALRLLLAHGARVDLQDASDGTPLHWAAAHGSAESVGVLLEHGAAVNAMDNEGNTPLHTAIRVGASPVVMQLLDRGADADRENKAGVTPRALLQVKVDQTMLIVKALQRGREGPAAERRAAV